MSSNLQINVFVVADAPDTRPLIRRACRVLSGFAAALPALTQAVANVKGPSAGTVVILVRSSARYRRATRRRSGVRYPALIATIVQPDQHRGIGLRRSYRLAPDCGYARKSTRNFGGCKRAFVDPEGQLRTVFSENIYIFQMAADHSGHAQMGQWCPGRHRIISITI